MPMHYAVCLGLCRCGMSMRYALWLCFCTLLLPVALFLCGCGIEYENIGLHDAGWQTYQNAEFGYELSYPREWELQTRDPRPDDAIETHWSRVSGVTQKPDTPPSDESVLVAVNFQSGWCANAGRVETRDVVVDGVAGVEYECFRTGSDCLPQPNCQNNPYGIARFFENVQGRQNYLVLADPTSDPLLVRRIIESFRFFRRRRGSRRPSWIAHGRGWAHRSYRA